MSTVEFHPWNSRRADTERPDEWRIDLDPMPECGFDTVRRVAHVAHEVLDELGAVGWPKTSGGSGMHVYVRIEPRWGFADVRRAALAFAREVERRAPQDVTTTWWRKDRDPRALFVDYNQNARDHTIASAYSVRGVPEATVSTPITLGRDRRRRAAATARSPRCPAVSPRWATCTPASTTRSSPRHPAGVGRPGRARGSARPRRPGRRHGRAAGVSPAPPTGARAQASCGFRGAMALISS